MIKTLVLLALAIFVFLLLKKKRAKPGSIVSYNSGGKSLTAPESFRFFFTKNNPSFTIQDVKVGDSVSLWHKPDSDSIHVYLGGTVAGEGFIGRFLSEYLVNNYFSKNIRVKATVDKIEQDMIYLSPHLQLTDPIEKQEEYYQKDLQLLQKAYNPKSNLIVVFSLKEGVNWNKTVQLKHSSFEKALADFQDQKDWNALTTHFWLENLEGDIVSLENYSKKDDTIKLFRAINSGIAFDIKYHKTEYGAGGAYQWDLIPKK